MRISVVACKQESWWVVVCFKFFTFYFFYNSPKIISILNIFWVAATTYSRVYDDDVDDEDIVLCMGSSSSSNEEIMVACWQKTVRTPNKVPKKFRNEAVLRTRNCQIRPKLSFRIASGEQFSLQVPLKRWQRWWRGHRGWQAVPHPSRRHRKSAVANSGEASKGYGERVRGRRAETPTSFQIGNAMEVTS